jgi:hypothetical protein
MTLITMKDKHTHIQNSISVYSSFPSFVGSFQPIKSPEYTMSF